VKILLLGGNGQLGQTLASHAELGTLGEVVVATRDGKLAGGGSGEVGDLSDLAGLRALLERMQPDIIINAAAYTAVDRAETEEALATRINGEAPGAIGAWAHAHGSLVLHYSTDYVFDGQASTPYLPDAPTAPIGAYGRSKLAGEQALQQSGARHLILRTAWVYAPVGHNFLRTMLRLGAERDELRVVADQHGAPTTTKLIADGSIAALRQWLGADGKARDRLQGIHHLVAGGSTTWHGFASAIVARAHALGLLEKQPKVSAITTADFPTPARRPHYSVLDNRGFEKTFHIHLPSWQAGLDDVLEALAAKGTQTC
jgi:dTDP-4-dehydrorhamnose reductase